MRTGPPSRIRNRTIGLAPPLVLAIVYALLMGMGAALLLLPAASTHPITASQALFTAVSAVTVTGLVVVDTGTSFTLFGQIVILTLIQMGGLGIMTFAVLILAMLGQSVGLHGRIYLRDELSQTSLADLLKTVKVIFKVMLVCELFGTAALALVFVPESGWAQGFWLALFHAVSAFNNAGFALFSDSLATYAAHPILNMTVPLLILIGGLGVSVIADVNRTRRWAEFSLHTRLMLAGTAVIVPVSVALIAGLEWHNPDTLGQFASALQRWMAAWFQAISTRTAGFSTMEIGAIEDASALAVIGLMFIGAGSTSTAGGIKLTTLIVLLLAVLSFVRRRSELDVFGRTLSHDQVMKLWVLSLLAMLVVILGVFVLTLSHEAEFLVLLFEAVSAFGTVGLSYGITPELNGVGQAALIVLMFIGRLGPLALGLFLATRSVPRVRYPAGQIHIG